ncbi:hypothetical protein EXIGLDRAFT_775114 [Exidia glandulosa HHB12029]|uniref:Chitinase n=1 Tax=Exidia glandulosa HHB12029 TaxID=1314781 RepID=A0A165E2F8_EXIGL|nr:hypothetical protein EXIGLDRAFT_775114 [Exidia glandulosa HHB12029]
MSFLRFPPRASAGASLKLPVHPLAGSLALNGSRAGGFYLPLGNTSSEWDIISLEGGLLTPLSSQTESSKLSFGACFPPTCSTHESEAALIAAIKQRVDAGGVVQFSVGGTTASGFLQLFDLGGFNNFVTAVQGIVKRYGFNGFNIDLWSTGCVMSQDPDYQRPENTNSVYIISAIQKLRAIFGPSFTLSVTSSFAFDGHGALDASISCLSVIHALRDDVTFVSIYPVPLKADSLIAPDGKTYAPSSSDYWAAAADIAVGGRTGSIPVYNTTSAFPALRPNQTFIYLMASSGLDAMSNPGRIENAMSCITSGENCDSYKPQSGPHSDFRGFMVMSVETDELQNAPFRRAMRPYLDSMSSAQFALPASASFTSTSTSTTPSPSAPSGDAVAAKPESQGRSTRAVVIAVPIVTCVIVFLLAGWIFVPISPVTSGTVSSWTRVAGSEAAETSSPANIHALQTALDRAGFSFTALLTSLNRVHEDVPDERHYPPQRDGPMEHSGDAPPTYHDRS